MAVPISYVTTEYYRNVYGGKVTDNINNRIYNASRHIDALTFNRLVGKDPAKLSDYQSEILKRVVCGLVDFEAENEDIINSVLSAYSINGVSMTMDGSNWNITVQNGVAIKSDLFQLLESTGLCCRVI